MFASKYTYTATLLISALPVYCIIRVQVCSLGRDKIRIREYLSVRSISLADCSAGVVEFSIWSHSHFFSKRKCKCYSVTLFIRFKSGFKR